MNPTAQSHLRTKTTAGKSLALQLFLLTILPLTLLLLFITFGSTALHQQAMRSLVRERDKRAALAASLAISTMLKHQGALIQNLAVSVAAGAEPERLLSEQPSRFEDFDAGIALVDRSGAVLAFGPTNDVWMTLKERQLLDAVSELAATVGEIPVFSSALVDALTGDYLVFVASGPTDGPVVMGAFSPEKLVSPILDSGFRFAPNQRSGVVMIDANDLVLYRTGDLANFTADLTQSAMLAELQGQEGATFVQMDGGEHVMAYSSIPEMGWALVVSEPWKTVSNPFLRTTLFAPLALAPILLIALVALWFGARQIVDPLQRLEAKAAALAWGRFEPIEEPVGGIAEIQRLQRELIHLAHKVKLAQQNLRNYIGAITAGQEEERKRLARELHDDTLQALIALNQRAQLAQMETTDPAILQTMTDIQQLAEQTIADLRRFVRALRPIYLEDLGLITALQMLLKETEQAAGLKTIFSLRGSPRRLPSSCELALYRMAQEAVSNVVRHAQASAMSLILDFSGDLAVIMTIVDDGCGFIVPDNPAEFASAGHFGLLGLQERSELIGATLVIASEPGQGTRITIRMPYASMTSA